MIVFNSEYELIGAGAVLTPHVGGVRAILKRNFTSADGIWFFHLIVGTTLNCIVDITFRYVSFVKCSASTFFHLKKFIVPFN